MQSKRLQMPSERRVYQVDNKTQSTPQSQPDPVVTQIPPAGGEDNKMMLWAVVGLVLVILVVGGVYFYLNSQQKPSPTPSSDTPQTQENLENDLNAIKVEDMEKDFSSVDQDLQSL